MSKLTVAFAILRKQGFIAKQNFSCCQGCAGYELATQVSEDLDEGKSAPAGCVFYTKQDAEALKAGKSRKNAWRFGFRRAEHMYLSYGPLSTEKHGEIGLPAEEVGKAVVAALTAAGIETEWDGDGGSRIQVKIASLN